MMPNCLATSATVANPPGVKVAPPVEKLVRQ